VQQKPWTSTSRSRRCVAGRQPRIAERRITVHDIAIWHERLVGAQDEIATE
jgi:uncharacterized protein (DUF433 family)